MKKVNHLEDLKAGCHSYLCTVELSWYLDFVKHAYDNDGGIEGQRKALNTQAGRRIRNQMVDDFKSGGVLPPVVIGVEFVGEIDGTIDIENQIKDVLSKIKQEDICIIDGMQRTTAMIETIKDLEVQLNLGEISEADFLVIKSREIRVEFWVAKKIHSLLYRMLVLNTGQVPWTLRRQVEVVFHSLKKEMIATIDGLNLLEVDNGDKRRAGGSFHANKLIELFLITGTRTDRIDVKEKLADDFLKLDFIENASDKELTYFYFKIVKIIVSLDAALERNGLVITNGRFSKGLDLFSSQPALTAFCSAISQYVLGRPGMKYQKQEAINKMQFIEDGFAKLTKRMIDFDEEGFIDFIAFDVLNEAIAVCKKSAKIGDEERAFFKNAFKVIIEDKFEIASLEVCWRV